MASDYGGAQTLLECVFGVDLRESTCKDKVEVGWRFTLTGRVTTPTSLQQGSREEPTGFGIFQGQSAVRGGW